MASGLVDDTFNIQNGEAGVEWGKHPFKPIIFGSINVAKTDKRQARPMTCSYTIMAGARLSQFRHRKCQKCRFNAIFCWMYNLPSKVWRSSFPKLSGSSEDGACQLLVLPSRRPEQISPRISRTQPPIGSYFSKCILSVETFGWRFRNVSKASPANYIWHQFGSTFTCTIPYRPYYMNLYVR
jgi:hypothetical protein